MNKYIRLFQNYLSLISAYRIAFMWDWIFRLVNLLVYYLLWSLTANSEEDLYKLLSYFVLYYFIFQNSRTGKVARFMADSVREGRLNSYLIKPIDFKLVSLIQITSQTSARLIIPIILIILGIVFFPQIFAPASVISLILFLFFTFLGLLMWHVLMLLFGSFSFWVKEIANSLTVLDLLLNIIDGAFIPFYLFSERFRQFLSYTPVPYLGAFQIEVYFGRTDYVSLIIGFVIVSFWLFLFWILTNYFYSLGLKRYDGTGG